MEGELPARSPSITAVVTCHNQAPFVLEALASIAAQERRPDQLVVVDDGSTDGSQSAVAAWLEHSEIPSTLIANGSNVGICRVMNLALEKATGDYIAVLHGDDVWLPNKLRLQAAALDATSDDVSLVYSDAEVIDEHGRPLEPSVLDRYGVPRPRPSGQVTAQILDRTLQLAGHATLIKRAWLDKVGPYDERLRAEDYSMWLRLALRSQFVFVDAVVAKWRVVPTSLSHVLASVYLQDDLLTITSLVDAGAEPRQLLLRHQALIASHLYRRGPQARAALRARIRHEQPLRAAALALLTVGGLVPQGLGVAARVKRLAGLRHMALD
ncbi:MAG TPA: glycosyltransferase [Candidatus Dormibacteraeota bacterium]